MDINVISSVSLFIIFLYVHSGGMLLNKKSLKKLNTLKSFKKIKMVRWFSLSQKQDIGQFDFKHELEIQNISLNGW